MMNQQFVIKFKDTDKDEFGDYADRFVASNTTPTRVPHVVHDKN